MTKNFWIMVVAALFCTGICSSASASEYQYASPSPLMLGGGYSPGTPTQAFTPCTTFTAQRDENTSVSTQYSLQLVSTREQLYTSLGISVVISAQYALFNGSSNTDFENAASFDDQSLTVVLKASDDFGKVVAENIKLTPEAQHLVDTKQWGAFAKKCGTEVVLQEEKGASIVAIYSFRNLSTSQQESIKAVFAGSATYGLASGSSNMALNQLMQIANQLSSVSISVFALGGEGLKSLSGLVTSSQNSDAVKGVFDQYIQGMTFDTAAPTSYTTNSFSNSFSVRGWVDAPFDTSVRDNFIVQLYLLEENTKSEQDRLKELSTPGGTTPYDQLVTDAQRTTYANLYSEYVDAISAIVAKAQSCEKTVSQCFNIRNVYPPTVQWPQFPPLPKLVNITISSVASTEKSTQFTANVLTHMVSGTLVGDPRFIKYMYIGYFPTAPSHVPDAPLDKLGPWLGQWQDLNDITDNPDPQDLGMKQASFSRFGFTEALTCQYSGPFGDFCHNGLAPWLWKNNSGTAVLLYTADVFGQQNIQQLWP